VDEPLSVRSALLSSLHEVTKSDELRKLATSNGFYKHLAAGEFILIGAGINIID